MMGVIKMKLMLNNLQGVDTKLLASAILQFPRGTTFVGMDIVPERNLTVLMFHHPLFKHDADVMPQFIRDTAICDGEVIEIDHFCGLNMREILVDDDALSGLELEA